MTRKLIRWKAVVPLAIVVVLVAATWILFLDRIVKRSVEQVGATIVGARVDVDEADVRLADGTVLLRGLQVTNPDQPMRNLFEAREIVAAVRVLPLLEKKIVIDTLALRDVRFGTERRESGALPRREGSGVIAERVSEWASQIRLPPLSLEGLGQVIDVSAVRVDSLRTLAVARSIVTGADSARQAWEGRVRALNPDPVIDSARALADRLKGADIRTLGIGGARDAATSVRSTIARVKRMRDDVGALEQNVTAGVRQFKESVNGLADAKNADLAYARGLLNLPSLDAPDISPAVFGDLALQRLKPILYWVQVAEQYLPPGLDPRRRVGPQRARASGETVEFPRERAYPSFLLEFAEASLSIGGTGVTAGDYIARAAGFTSSPALYGRPARLLAGKTGTGSGPREIRLSATLDHVRPPMRDSVDARIAGVSLPAVTINPLQARLNFEGGSTQINVVRVGDSLQARWVVRSDNVTWERLSGDSLPSQGPIGSKAWAEGILWRTVSGLKQVEIEARLSGAIAKPRLAVGSNVGPALAQSLKREIGAEVERAEQLVRAKIDSVTQAGVREAEAKVAVLETEIQGRIAQQRQKLEQVQGELESRLRALVPRLPGGDLERE